MQIPNKRKTGVWVDQRNAIIVNLINGQEQVIKLDSEVDESRPKGGAGTSIPYDRQEPISEKNHLERRKQQLGKFYARIIRELNDSDSIIVLGPGEAKTGLVKKMRETPGLHDRLALIHTMDSPTENQIKAKIRDLF